VSDDAPALSETLFEVFGAGSWVFLPAIPARGVATELEAEILDEQFSWGDNPHIGEGAGVLVLTAPVNGWMLLQGATETVGGAAALLSEQRDVYRAMIDVRLPAMSWSYLENGMPVRTVTVELGDDGALVTRTTGEPRPFEAERLTPPTSPFGYDSFFFPIAILAELGVRVESLEWALGAPSVTLRVL
jgi:hypothetical protein